MYCMKCGREIPEDDVFCNYCLAEMENHPVNPGTVILLPKQDPASSKKPPKKKRAALTPEEQISGLKKKVWGLRVISTLLFLLLGIMSYFAYEAISELDLQRLIGKNYNTVETSPPTEEPTEEAETTETQ